MESPDDAPWPECGNGCGAMVEDPNWRKPAPWCPECQAAQYRGEFGLETDEQRLLRHLAEFNEAVADACNGLPDDTPDHVRAMADAINPAPDVNTMGYESISNAHDATVYERGSEHGQRFERAAIVAWLRDFGNPTSPALPLVAEAIERAEHLRGDDE